MDIEEYFKDNKKLLKIVLAIYIILAIVILYFIWVPKDSSTNFILKYEEINESETNERTMQECMNNIAYKFILDSKDILEEMINKDYLKYRGITSDDLIEELEESGFFIPNTTIKDITKYKVGNTYVYRGTLTNGVTNRYINVIEDYPYNYTITFDSFFKTNTENIEKKKNKVKFEILEATNHVSHIAYKIKITNIGNEYCIFNLNENNKMSIYLADGNEYVAEYPNGAIYKETKLSKGSSIVINIMFSVPLQKQGDIKSIIFKDVRIDIEQTNIIVDL